MKGSKEILKEYVTNMLKTDLFFISDLNVSSDNREVVVRFKQDLSKYITEDKPQPDSKG